MDISLYNINDIMNLIDSMYDEVLIYDNNYRIVYINKSCQRHYNCKQEDMIGKNFFDYVDNDFWEPSILPIIYKEKKPYAIKQKTYLGIELFTIAVPIFDDNNNLKYVVMNVRDNLTGIDLYNPNYSIKNTSNKQIKTPIGNSPEVKNVLEMAHRIGNVDVTCILSGESGTGKTMLARYIHSVSNRSNQPFISINCASIPENLIESELFGYEKGAFTGANSKGKKGLFEAADKGTLLLDEISELPLSAQAKLLHVIQEQKFIPVGSNKPVSVDVRIIAATNKNLKELSLNKQFREDLYYRLSVVELYISPLKNRKSDIPLLVNHFLDKFNNKYSTNKTITKSALKVLENAEWKGNIRELEHTIERLIVTNDNEVIDVINLPKTMFGIIDNSKDINIDSNITFDEKISRYESILVKEAYRKFNTSRKLAEYLGISQTRANNLIRKYIK